MFYECHQNTWKTLPEDKVVCNLCPFKCVLDEGQSGVCRVRRNKNGKLILSNYGNLIDPVFDRIQKRPVYLYPGYAKEDKTVNSLSLGSTGCNNRCPFCQNFEISQESDWEGLKEYSILQLVQAALNKEVDFISFSFNEVIVIYEFFADIADVAKEKGLKICVKTAGYISEEFHDDFLDRIDTMNLDIKPLDDDYIRQCGILDHDVILRLLKKAFEKGIHTEISHILIEGVNDNEKCMRKLADLVKTHNPSMGVHLLRHYPAWKSEYPVTADENLAKWRDYLQKEGLENVFNDDVG